MRCLILTGLAVLAIGKLKLAPTNSRATPKAGSGKLTDPNDTELLSEWRKDVLLVAVWFGGRYLLTKHYSGGRW